MDNEPKLCTTNGKSVEEVRAAQTNKTGQHDGYIVLCAEERAKGFVRPFRDSYIHVGEQPVFPLRDLTEEEKLRHAKWGYMKFEQYPPSEESSMVGRFWTEAQLVRKCGTITKMGRALAETYARDPKFYSGTYCHGCAAHFPVSEFRWAVDNEVVGS